MKAQKKGLGDVLERLYKKYNHPKYVHPDPLEFLYDYSDVREREIVALIAASLAYGRVAQILKSVSRVMEKLGPRPADFLAREDIHSLQKTFAGFRHRFADGEQLSAMLAAAGDLIKEYGSLNAAFSAGVKPSDETILGGMEFFCEKLCSAGNPAHLVPLPSRGSACKRMNLFLRWMVREDKVDPGGWADISPSKLIVPVDVHMHRMAVSLGLTKRKQANMKAALEITQGFAELYPEDPARYDFVLTRPGIGGTPVWEEISAFFTHNPS